MYIDNVCTFPAVATPPDLRAGMGDSPAWSPSEGEVDLSLFARTDTPRLAYSNFIQDGNSELKPNFPGMKKKRKVNSTLSQAVFASSEMITSGTLELGELVMLKGLLVL